MTSPRTETYRVPLRTRSALNAREHYFVRAKRVKMERAAVALVCAGLAPLAADERATVTLTRIAPRMLDGHDGLPASMKGVADELTVLLGLPHDRDARVDWRYAQRRGRVREYGVEVVVGRQTNSTHARCGTAPHVVL